MLENGSLHEAAVFTPRRALILVVVPALLLGCAPGRVGKRPADAPVANPPAPTAGPSPGASPAPATGSSAAPAASPAPPAAAARIDFEPQILPLLQEKCSPCHFPGGRMYDGMPFDREATIRTLGEAMLTRLRDPVDQDLLRAFLAQSKRGTDGSESR